MSASTFVNTLIGLPWRVLCKHLTVEIQRGPIVVFGETRPVWRAPQSCSSAVPLLLACMVYSWGQTCVNLVAFAFGTIASHCLSRDYTRPVWFLYLFPLLSLAGKKRLAWRLRWSKGGKTTFCGVKTNWDRLSSLVSTAGVRASN